MTIRIRKYQKKDGEAVSKIIVHTFKTINADDAITSEGLSGYLNHHADKGSAKERYNKPIAYVAVDNAKVIGYIGGTKEKLTNIYLKTSYIEKGIGKQLMQKYIAQAKKEETTEIKLIGTGAAVSFYQKMGFKKTRGPIIWRGVKCQPMKYRL